MQYDREKGKSHRLDDTLSVLAGLKAARPDLWERAEVVGRWVWIGFDQAPPEADRRELLERGFHWNHQRRCWQHCGGRPSTQSGGDPRVRYGVVPATDLGTDEAEAALA